MLYISLRSLAVFKQLSALRKRESPKPRGTWELVSTKLKNRTAKLRRLVLRISCVFGLLLPQYCVRVVYLIQSSPSTALPGVYFQSLTFPFESCYLRLEDEAHSTRYDRRTAKYISKTKPSKLVVTGQFSCKNNFRNVNYYNKQFFSKKKLIFSIKFSVFDETLSVYIRQTDDVKLCKTTKY